VIPVGEPVNAVAISPDGRYIATGSGWWARVWDLGTGSKLCEWQACDRHFEVTCLAFGPDGRLATASNDMTARIWDPGTGRQLGQFTHARRVRTVAFGPDGRLATASDDKTARIWEAITPTGDP